MKQSKDLPGMNTLLITRVDSSSQVTSEGSWFD